MQHKTHIAKADSQPWADLAAAEEEAGSGHKQNWTNDDQGSHLNNSFADADSWSDADGWDEAHLSYADCHLSKDGCNSQAEDG